MATKNLYFLEIISRALQQWDQGAAIEKAFVEIAELGKNSEYRQGFLQFNKFMEEVFAHESRERYLDIVIFKNGKQIMAIPIAELSFVTQVKNILPGHYEFRLDTGRIIWQGEFTEKDLFWTYAFPGRALALAADTGHGSSRKTREIKLLNGEMIIRVFPELESGRIELEIKESNLG